MGLSIFYTFSGLPAGCPLAGSHNLASLSMLPDAASFPSGENAQHLSESMRLRTEAANDRGLQDPVGVAFQGRYRRLRAYIPHSQSRIPRASDEAFTIGRKCNTKNGLPRLSGRSLSSTHLKPQCALLMYQYIW